MYAWWSQPNKLSRATPRNTASSEVSNNQVNSRFKISIRPSYRGGSGKQRKRVPSHNESLPHGVNEIGIRRLEPIAPHGDRDLSAMIGAVHDDVLQHVRNCACEPLAFAIHVSDRRGQYV